MAKSKLTDDLRETICDLLREGHTDQDTCDAVGIHKSSFYNWLNQGEKATRGKFCDFFDAVTRARAEARLANVRALQEAARGKVQTVVEETEIFTETKLDRKGEPYQYKKEHTKRQVTYHPVDWRAALEYLKRRDTDHWSEKVVTEQHITIEGSIESAADEFERLIAQRANSGGDAAVAGQADDTTEGGATV